MAAVFGVGPDGDPDRYRLGALINAGAEGSVYEAFRTVAGVEHRVAVKVLSGSHDDAFHQWARRWEAQVETLRSVSHPAIVAVREGFVGPPLHELGTPPPAGRALYLVMNFVDGTPLDELISRSGTKDVLETVRLLLPVATALDHMHSGVSTGGVPVIHRDVKPANILVTPSGQSVLVDFGVSMAGAAGVSAPGIGTNGFVAPEAASGQYLPASDRWSFGAVTAFVLTGRSSAGPSELDLTAALGHLDEEALTVVVDGLLDLLDDDPEARPAPLVNWLAGLRGATLTPVGLAPGGLGASTATVRTATVDSVATPTARSGSKVRGEATGRRRAGVLVAATVAIAALVAGALALLPDSTPTTLAGDGAADGPVPTAVLEDDDEVLGLAIDDENPGDDAGAGTGGDSGDGSDGGENEAEAIAPSPTETANTVGTSTTPTSTPVVTPGATAEATPTPGATATPTATAVPTATSTPIPTPTATASPTATPIPTATPFPTATPIPTATPTPIPSATPIPTATPTPAPTATPTPTEFVHPNRTSCDPDAYAAAAAIYIDQQGYPVAWVDSDGDCLDNYWEINASGTSTTLVDSNDNGTPDGIESGFGQLPSIQEQMDFAAGG